MLVLNFHFFAYGLILEYISCWKPTLMRKIRTRSKENAGKFIRERRSQNSKGAQIFRRKVIALHYWVSQVRSYSTVFFFWLCSSCTEVAILDSFGESPLQERATFNYFRRNYAAKSLSGNLVASKAAGTRLPSCRREVHGYSEAARTPAGPKSNCPLTLRHTCVTLPRSFKHYSCYVCR